MIKTGELIYLVPTDLAKHKPRVYLKILEKNVKGRERIA